MAKTRVFVADWCPHCQEAKEMINELKCDVELVDIDQNEAEARGLGISEIPVAVESNGKLIPIESVLEKCKLKNKNCKKKK